jgi:hypothetical protein
MINCIIEFCAKNKLVVFRPDRALESLDVSLWTGPPQAGS